MDSESLVLLPNLPWSGGIDGRMHPMASDPDTARNLKNIIIGRDGRKLIRGGIRPYFANGSTYQGIGGTSYTSLVDNQPVRAIGSYAYSTYKRMWTIFNGGVYAFAGGSWTNDRAPNTLSGIPTWTPFGQYIIIALDNGIDRIVIWDPSSDSDAVYSTNSPIISLVRTHYNRLIGAGNPDEPDLWYASYVGDPNDWDPSVTEDADLGGLVSEIPGNHKIVAISPSHYHTFYIVTDGGLHQITGRSPTEYEHRLVSGSIANIGHRTLMNIQNSILGWNENGCISVSDTDKLGGVESSMLSSPIRHIFMEKVRRNPSEFFSVDVPSQDLYMTFMPSRESNATIVMVLQYDKLAWTWFEMPVVHSASIWDNGHAEILVMGDNTGLISYMVPGQLKDYDGMTGHSTITYETEIEVEIESQKLMLASSGRGTSNIRCLDIWCRPSHTGSVQVNVFLEGGMRRTYHAASVNWLTNPDNRAALGSFYLGTSRMSGNNAVCVSRHNLGGNCQTAQVKISGNASSLGPIELLGFQFGYSPSGGLL